MNVLGIETSCDETAAAVVKNGKTVLSNIVATSLKEHSKFGGVIPEIASRRQLEYINAVVKESLSVAKVSLKQIDGIAVTRSPGLVGSLLVGISFAEALSAATGKKLINVDHIRAHLYASFLINEGEDKPLPKLPAIGLVVSGGHTSLYYIKDFQSFKLLGQTRDDAAGEAFDKVARILDLGYPGGPVIDRLAKSGKNSDIRFTCAALADTLDFSFSGIKTAVLYHHRDNKTKKTFSRAKVAYAFQNAVVETLVTKCVNACRRYKIKTLVIGGGVAANSQLRDRLKEEGAVHDIEIHCPKLSLCLDNAAMIAGLGFHLFNKGEARDSR